MIQNIIIGTPVVEPWELISNSQEEFDKRDTYFTNERFLPAVLAAAGVAKSASEVRRNRKDLVKILDSLDCFWVKWGKNKIYVIVGE